jgi:S-phase kinase-associated protein 1
METQQSQDLVTVQSSDGTEFKMTRDAAKASKTIRELLESMEEMGADPTNGCSEAIPLPNVNSKALAKLVEYCSKYPFSSPAPLVPNDQSKSLYALSDWEKTFLDVPNDFLFELILAANYLDIEPLLSLCCKNVANMLRGKNPEEIRELFNIKKDFTPAEEEQIRKENEWCEER